MGHKHFKELVLFCNNWLTTSFVDVFGCIGVNERTECPPRSMANSSCNTLYNFSDIRCKCHSEDSLLYYYAL